MEIPEVDFTFVYLFLFLAIPGLVFRKFYYQGEFSKQFISKNWAYTLTTSFLIGIIIQLISFYSIKGFFQVFGKPASEKYIIKLSDFKNLKHILDGLNLYEFTHYDKKIFIIVAYILITCLVAFIAALICWHFVRRLKLDRKFKLLRFGNLWNYYLRGEIIDFKDFSTIKESKKVILTLIDIVISDGFKENKLFSGILSQYTIDSNSTNLETITLTDAHVWKEDKNSKSQTFGRNIKKRVKGHCLILDVKKSIDLNLTYVFENDNESKFRSNLFSFLNLIIILGYLFFFIITIISSSSLFIIESSIINTIILKIYLIFLLTLIMSIFFNMIQYLESGNEWTDNEKSEKLKGVVIIVIFTLILMIIYRLIRFGDFSFWYLH
ncbi:hypothetical protein [Algibacter pacificus]|uniref:hypothetical protein n=1 Tax=Algibacter pacificus TaxID=2599389 RepID=UPI0011CC30E7|nr:hypothetical protein [Algibacter pacificus]